MLHSFYTEIEKLLKIIAREWDRGEEYREDAGAGDASPSGGHAGE